MRRAVALSALVVLTAALLGHAAPASAATRFIDEVFANATVTSNIAYGQALDQFGQPETLLLDVYQPAGDTVTNRPIVIFVHGGGFTGGSKTSPDAVDYARSMAKRGYVSASINYRLRQDPIPSEEMAQAVLDAKHDAQAAIRWFRANALAYDADPDRISIAGYSAGAATALFAAYTPDDPGDSGNPGYSSAVSAVIGISGGMGNAADDVIDPDEPPMMLIHGTADATAPYSNALLIVDAANAAGVYNELHTLQGANHSKFGPVYMADMTQWSGEFLYTHVVNPAGVGGLTSLPLAFSDETTRDLPSRLGWLIVGGLLVGPLIVGADWLLHRRRR